MSGLVLILFQYANRRCDAPVPVESRPTLVNWLAQHQLILCEDTTTNGNCGIHAFWLSLADFARHTPNFKKNNAWKQLSKKSTNTSQLIKHLRDVAVTWMKDNADVSVWDGMRFRDLACQMSHLQ